MKDTHCILQVGDDGIYIVECFENKEQAKQKVLEYKNQYHQEYYVETVQYHLSKGE
jgi:hypothetical protein